MNVDHKAVILPAIFTKAETLNDSSVKLIFASRELGGADTAQLFSMKGSECWLLIAPSKDTIEDAVVPSVKPDASRERRSVIMSEQQDLRSLVHQHSQLLLNGCWEWTGGKNKQGYGQHRWKGRMYGSHVLSYNAYIGPVPVGLELDHFKCRNRWCVNPDHLEAVTHVVNMERRRRPTCAKGHPMTGRNLVSFINNGKKYRMCRTCHNAARLVAYHRRKAERQQAAA